MWSFSERKHLLEQRKKGHSQNDVPPWLDHRLYAEWMVEDSFCSGLETPVHLFPAPREVGLLVGVGVGGVCIHKSKFQWPLSQKFLSPYLTRVSLSQSFVDTVSLLWNPAKSFPCYLSASTWGKKPSHLELLSNVCHPASQQRVGRSALCHTHLQND